MNTLRKLHERHLYSVPFENLDIGRRPIVIDEAAFVRKIVEERRGGFCYELMGARAPRSVRRHASARSRIARSHIRRMMSLPGRMARQYIAKRCSERLFAA